MEIIVTATLFGTDIYVASDTYRAGRPIWLKYSPNSTAATELQSSNIDLSMIPLLPQRLWLELVHVSNCHFDSVQPISAVQISRPFLSEVAKNTSKIIEL